MSWALAAPRRDVPLLAPGEHGVPGPMREDEPAGAEPPQVPAPGTPALPSGAGESPCRCAPQRGLAGGAHSPVAPGSLGFLCTPGSPKPE